ncbi:MAG: hypothetical protein K1W01_10500 [Muribaculaceae bacterium]
MKVKSLLTVACIAATISASAEYPIYVRDSGDSYNKETGEWSFGGHMSYQFTPGTQNVEGAKPYYGDPLVNEDGSITFTRVEGGGCWIRTKKLTEPCPMEYCIFAFDYKSNKEIGDIVIFHHEYAGRNDVDITSGKMLTVSDEFQTVYLPFNRALNGWGTEEDYTKNYLWISTNDPNGAEVGWQVSIKNLRMLTLDEASAECQEVVGDIAEAFKVPNTDLTGDLDADMENTTVYVRPANGDTPETQHPNPLFWTSNMIKPLPITAGKLSIDYKLSGPTFTAAVWLTSTPLGKILTFEGTEDGVEPEALYEMPWKNVTIDLTDKIKETGWAQKFGSNDFLQIQLMDMLAEEQMLWIKDVKWLNSKQPGESGVAEIGVAERPADNRVFNLMGVEVKGELAPGLYIRNGKKFIVK